MLYTIDCIKNYVEGSTLAGSATASNCTTNGFVAGSSAKFGGISSISFSDSYSIIWYTDKDNAKIGGACVLGIHSLKILNSMLRCL